MEDKKPCITCDGTAMVLMENGTDFCTCEKCNNGMVTVPTEKLKEYEVLKLSKEYLKTKKIPPEIKIAVFKFGIACFEKGVEAMAKQVITEFDKKQDPKY